MSDDFVRAVQDQWARLQHDLVARAETAEGDRDLYAQVAETAEAQLAAALRDLAAAKAEIERLKAVLGPSRAEND